MATVLTPHCWSQSAIRCRSPVKVPKLRTGSGSQSGLTAATCKVAPMSIAAAWACTGDIARVRRENLVVATEPSFDVRQWGGWAARQINFLTGIVLLRDVTIRKCAA